MSKEELKFTEILESERIKLKLMNPTLENAKLHFELIDKNRKHLESWFPWVESTKKFFDVIEFLITKEEIMYGIFDFDDNYMGSISMIKLDIEKKKSGEMGYWLGKEFTGKGYMTEAVKILEKEFFENFNLNRVVIRCNYKNKGSEMVARRSGYFFEGVSRQDRFNDFSGQLEDSLNFSKLKSEYEKNKK